MKQIPPLTNKLRHSAVELVIIVFLVGFTACKESRTENSNHDQTYYEVKRENLEIIVPVVGQFKAKDTFRTTAPYTTLIEKMIAEGEILKKGDLVAKLDTASISEEMEDEQLQLQIKKTELELKKVNHNYKRFMLEKQVKLVQKKLEKLEASLKLKVEGLDYPEYLRLLLAIQNGEKRLLQLETQYRKKQSLFEKGYLGEIELARFLQDIEKQRLAVETLKTELKLLVEGKDMADIKNSELDIKKAQVELKTAEKELESFKNSCLYDYQSTEVSFRNSLKKVEYLKDLRSQGNIVSSIDGIMVYEDVWISFEEKQKAYEGMNIRRGEEFFHVARLSNMEICATINEVDAKLIKPDQKVRFRLCAYPDKVYTGKISTISSVARYVEWDIQLVTTLDITIDPDEDSPLFKPGWTVFCDIIVQTIPDVLTVPTEAARNGKVTVAGGESRTVRLGQSSFTKSAIEEGLKLGDKVLVNPQFITVNQDMLDQMDLTTVKRKPFQVKLSDVGELKSKGSIPISAKRRTSIVSLVEEWKEVKQGELIATLEAKNYEDKVQEQELLFNELKTEENLKKKKYEQEIYQYQKNIEAADVALKEAEISLNKLLQGASDYVVKDLVLESRVLETKLKKAEMEAQIQRYFHEIGLIPLETLEKVEHEYSQAKAEYSVVQAKLKIQKQGARPLEIIHTRSNYEEANLSLELSQKNLKNREQEYELEKVIIKDKIFAAEQKLNSYRRILEESKIKAPIPGVVLYLKRWTETGQVKIKKGDTVYSGFCFLEITTLDDFKISGLIQEDEVAKVKEGQRVEFYLTNYPDERYKARVKKIGLFPKEKEENFFEKGYDKYFEVEFETNEKSRKFQPNMTVKFEIIVQEYHDVIAIKRDALFNDSHGDYVLLPGGKKRYVKTGEFNESEIIINDGLNEGEQVYTLKKKEG